MAITRRQFIKRTGLATAGALVGPSLLHSPWLSKAMAATIGDRYLIVLFLDGGNDGLNTVIPVTGPLRVAYEDARRAGGGGVRVLNPLVPANPFSDPLSGEQLGFHPGLAALSDMYDQGMVAVVQGCGYPQYSLSHDVSRSIWRRGAPLSAPGTGWVGRYLAAAGYTGSDIPAVNIGGEVAGEYLQSATSVLVYNRLQNFGFPYDFAWDDDEDIDDAPYKDAAFSALYGAASANGHPFMQYLGGTGNATLNAANSYPPLHDEYRSDRGAFYDLYASEEPGALNTGTSRALREIAKVIYGVARGVPNVTARHFECGNGGYDTHSDQGADQGAHYDLHAEVAQALKLFYDDLADMSSGASPGSSMADLPSKVLTVVYSEFSRRIPQNDNGTDHGSQGPMLVVGGGVNGGIYGEHPNIEEDALGNDGNTRYRQDHSNVARSTDFRDVYGTIIKHWLNITNPATLAAMLPHDGTLGFSGPNYWLTPDFDLPFL